MSIQKAPNSYVINLVRRHTSEILTQLLGPTNFIEEPELVEEHSLPSAPLKSGTTSRAEAKSKTSKTSNNRKSEKVVKRSSFKDKDSGKDNKPSPPTQQNSNRAIKHPQKRLSTSTTTTDELTDLRMTANHLKENKTKTNSTNSLCSGTNSLQSSKDIMNADSLAFTCPKTISCKNIEKSVFDFHDDEEDLARLKTLPDLSPEFDSRVKVLSYRTQVEKGLNFLVHLEIDEKRYLVCIWERSDMCASSLVRVTEFK